MKLKKRTVIRLNTITKLQRRWEYRETHKSGAMYSVFSIFSYDSEAWIINASDKQYIDAFEMKCSHIM